MSGDAGAPASNDTSPDLGQLTSVVLAGGLGTRLRPITGASPKVLAPVNGRPFLTYVLDQLAAAGIVRAVLCSGYLGDQLESTLGAAWGPLELTHARELEPLGTAGALANAAPLLKTDPVIALNGDSFCEVDLRAFLAWHAAQQRVASLVLTRVSDPGPTGWVQCRRATMCAGDDLDQRRHLPSLAAPARFTAGRPTSVPRTRDLSELDRPRAGWLPRRAPLPGHRHARHLRRGGNVLCQPLPGQGWVRGI